MKQLLKTLGAATVIGAFVLTVPPAMADVSAQGTGGKTTSGNSAHFEHHQQMNGNGRHTMMGQMMGHMMGQMMDGESMNQMSVNAANHCAADRATSAEGNKSGTMRQP